jgi:hypothetical protein
MYSPTQRETKARKPTPIGILPNLLAEHDLYCDGSCKVMSYRLACCGPLGCCDVRSICPQPYVITLFAIVEPGRRSSHPLAVCPWSRPTRIHDFFYCSANEGKSSSFYFTHERRCNLCTFCFSIRNNKKKISILTANLVSGASISV